MPIILSSCGGGGNSVVNPDNKINGITVAPAPDPAANNSTLAGIDSNNNGVRDDVERKIAEKFTSPEVYAKFLKYAKSEQLILVSELPKDRVSALTLIKATTCELNNIGRISVQLNIEDMLANTPQRVAKLKEFNNIVGGYFGNEVTCD